MCIISDLNFTTSFTSSHRCKNCSNHFLIHPLVWESMELDCACREGCRHDSCKNDYDSLHSHHRWIPGRSSSMGRSSKQVRTLGKVLDHGVQSMQDAWTSLKWIIGRHISINIPFQAAFFSSPLREVFKIFGMSGKTFTNEKHAFCAFIGN